MSLSPEGTAVVVDRADILAHLASKKSTATEEELSAFLNALSDTEFIRLKYVDGASVCVTPLAKARVATRMDKKEVAEIGKLTGEVSVIGNTTTKTVLLSVLCGVVGGVVGALVFELIKLLFS